MTGETLEEALGRRLEDGQREDLAVKMQGDVASQFLWKIFHYLLVERLKRQSARRTVGRTVGQSDR